MKMKIRKIMVEQTKNIYTLTFNFSYKLLINILFYILKSNNVILKNVI